jgi:hypothetical protein
MIRGITEAQVPGFVVKEYDKPGHAADFIPELLEGIRG